MDGSPPSVQANGLFATKGEAAPLTARADGDSRGRGSNSDFAADDPATAPATDLFGEIFEETPDAAETAANAQEPPPAASLLAIIAERSAATGEAAALPAPEATQAALLRLPPDPSWWRDTDSEGSMPPPETAEPEQTVTGLPVPVPGRLPTVIAAPARRGLARRYRLAAAAAVVLTAAAAVAAILSGGGPSTAPDVRTAVVGMPAPQKTAATEGRAEPLPASPDAATADTPVATPAPAGPAPGETEIGHIRVGESGSAVVADHAARGTAPMRDDSSLVVPRPARRPLPPAPYIVQLASLPSVADARREAAALAPKLADLFATDQYRVRSAVIDGNRHVYRVAVEGFETHESAVKTCAKVRALDQNCLVLRLY